jgi:hypothetical protein
MMPNHKRALQLYRETQQLATESFARSPHDYEYEVVEAAPLRRGDAAIHVSPQIIFIREPQRPELPPRKEAGPPDFMTQVFVAAFLGSSAFFVLYALITLMAGGRP